VLFPALSRLREDRPRQARAFLRASRLFMLVGVPLCLWQAAVADPAMRWLFEPEWAAAIPLVQLLSLSSSLRLPLGPAAGMIKAQGRFGGVAGFWLWNASLFLALVTAGALVAAAEGVAVAMLVYSAISGPLSLRIALGDAGGWRDVWAVYAIPVLGGGVAVGAGLAAAWAVGRGPLTAPWVSFFVISAVTAAAYALIVRAAAPAAWAEVAAQVQRRTGRRPLVDPDQV
jgi:O-antigen/teichoic acid export membrane protein